MFAFPSSGQSSRFLDSGVGFELDNFKLGTHAAQFLKLIVNKSTISKFRESVGLIQLNQWTHIAASVNKFKYLSTIKRQYRKPENR